MEVLRCVMLDASLLEIEDRRDMYDDPFTIPIHYSEYIHGYNDFCEVTAYLSLSFPHASVSQNKHKKIDAFKTTSIV